MGEALKVRVGPDAKELSASTIAGLKQVWGKEYQQWNGRDIESAFDTIRHEPVERKVA